MLYALVDYSNKKGFIKRYFAEEILGEVKILAPKSNKGDTLMNPKKVLKNIEKYNVQNVVLNNELVQNENFCEMLMEHKKYIVTGRRLGKALLLKILNDISMYTKYNIQKLKVVLLMDEYSIENLNLIECISKEVKQLSIVSKNHTKFEKTANKLFERYGYSIKLYGDEVKEFKRDNVIINLDFNSEMLKNMYFNKYGIIISLNDKITNLRKSFEGIIINDIDILGEGIPKENFRKLAVCEAKLYRPLRKVEDNEKVFFREKYKINGYIGRSGKITGEDFEKIGKNYT